MYLGDEVEAELALLVGGQGHGDVLVRREGGVLNSNDYSIDLL